MSAKLISATVENSIGAKATGVALRTAHTALADGYHVVKFKADAACFLQLTENDGTNDDVGNLNNGQQVAAGQIVVEVVPQKNGHTYTYAMVFASGTPSCDLFSLHEYDERP